MTEFTQADQVLYMYFNANGGFEAMGYGKPIPVTHSKPLTHKYLRELNGSQTLPGIVDAPHNGDEFFVIIGNDGIKAYFLYPASELALTGVMNISFIRSALIARALEDME